MTQRHSVVCDYAKMKGYNMYTASSIAKIVGTTVRTLQYYDSIGLFTPTDYTDSGYRLYDDDSVQVIREILLYRDLGFPLESIKSVLNCCEEEKRQKISGQIDALLQKRQAVDDEIAALKVLQCFGVETALEFMEKQKEKEK